MTDYNTQQLMRYLGWYLREVSPRYQPDPRGPVHSSIARRDGRMWLLLAVPLAERRDVEMPVFLRRDR